MTGLDPVSQQQHQIFPAIDLNLAPQWEINFGLGVGLTGSTDHLIAKTTWATASIFECDADAAAPAREIINDKSA